MVAQSIVGILFLLSAAFANFTHVELLTEEDNYRLPTSVVPTKYTIQLTFPDVVFTETVNRNLFDGTVTIDFRVDSEITEIKLHLSASSIDITNVKVQDLDVDYRTPFSEMLVIPITEEMSITPGNSYQMVITYTALISTTENYGIYKRTYIRNSDKETVYYLTTQFEPTYARRAFPCFDEPSFKANYDVSVTYPATRNLQVLFNTEKTAEPVLDGDTYTVTFKTTPAMSSFSVALTVSDFTSTDGTSPAGDTVLYKVWSRDDLSDSRGYALQITPTILQKLGEYTGRSYVQDMSKLDQIAFPDSTVEALGNWGLPTYREKYLLWAQDTSSVTSKQTVAKFVARELAHQWFGNLISCNWWSETFLNEGFATYFEYFIPRQIEATWELDKQFVVDILQSVLESDSATDSQALQSNVSTSVEAVDKFGPISYHKGGSIIRMLTHVMGEDNFKAGIQEYFIEDTGLLHGTSIPTKLWEILQKHVQNEYSGLPDGVTLTDVMQNWVEKAGYPLLTVTLNGKSLKISQERFLLTGEGKEAKWYVPITYVESESTTKFQETNPSTWLTPEASEATITLENENSWVLLNPLQTGFFRINYDTNLWSKISEALKKENFDGIVDLNRAQIVDDLFNLAKAEKITFSNVFTIIDFLKNDDSLYSWVSALKGFDFVLQRIPESSELRPYVQDQLLTLMKAFSNTVSFEEVKDNDQVYTSKQVLAFSWACTLGEEDCINKTKDAFNEYKINGTKPNVNLQSTIYCNALRNSDDVTDYEFLWNQYTETEVYTAIESDLILKSLGCSNNEVKLRELLTEIVGTSSKIPTQDTLTAFAAVYSGSSKGVDVILDLGLANIFSHILTKCKTASCRKALIPGFAEKLTTTAQVQRLSGVVESPIVTPADLLAEARVAVRQAEVRIKWLADHQEDLEKFFNGGSDDGPGDDGPDGDGASTIQINMVLLISLVALSILGLFSGVVDVMD